MVYFALKKNKKQKKRAIWAVTDCTHYFPNTKIPLSKLKPTQRAALNLLKFLGLSTTIESLQPIAKSFCHYLVVPSHLFSWTELVKKKNNNNNFPILVQVV